MTGRVTLIAHRGQPQKFPENSLQGFRHVLQAGAGMIETDVHFTQDGVAVLSHDSHLLKLTGKQIIVADHDFDEIRDIPAGYSDRFGGQFEDFRIASLQQLVELIGDWPEVKCFIELKPAALSNFGLKAVDMLIETLAPMRDQVAMISFDRDAVQYCQQHYADIETGWVLPDWSEENRQKAVRLAPAFLFVDTEFCPSQAADLWAGPWQWIVYTVNTAAEVAYYAGLGFELIETNRYSDLKQESDIVDVSTDF